VKGGRCESLLIYRIHEVHKSLDQDRLNSVCNIWYIHSTAAKSDEYIMHEYSSIIYDVSPVINLYVDIYTYIHTTVTNKTPQTLYKQHNTNPLYI